MKIVEELEELNHYYTSVRQVGNTTAIANAAKNLDSDNYFIIVHRHSMKNLLSEKYDIGFDNILSLSDVRFGKLRGTNRILLIDNAAMFEFIITVENRIHELEKQLKDIRCEIEKYRDNLNGVLAKIDRII